MDATNQACIWSAEDPRSPFFVSTHSLLVGLWRFLLRGAKVEVRIVCAAGNGAEHFSGSSASDRPFRISNGTDCIITGDGHQPRDDRSP